MQGGSLARLTWPRLAEYFARYQLCTNIPCSLEISALVISPCILQIDEHGDSNADAQDNSVDAVKARTFTSEDWQESFDLEREGYPNTARHSNAIVDNTTYTDKNARFTAHKAIERYLKESVPLEKFAHSMVPVKPNHDTNTKGKSAITGLEIAIVIHNTDYASNHDDAAIDKPATLSLIRFLNDTPILDSSDAHSCGIVQGLRSKKRLWNSFGLEINESSQIIDLTNVPTFEVKDSHFVSSLLNYGTHRLHDGEASQLLLGDKGRSLADSSNEQDKSQTPSRKRKRKQGRTLLLPAQVRTQSFDEGMLKVLGLIYCITDSYWTCSCRCQSICRLSIASSA
jgi:hypothetical protein